MSPDSRPQPPADLDVVGGPAALRKLLRKAREAGFFYALVLALRRILRPRVLYAGRTVLLELRPGPERAAGEHRGGIHWATPDESPQLTAFGHSLEAVQQRFSAGDRVCMLTEADRVLGYVWFHGVQHADENLGVRFDLDRHEIWLFDATVAADHRGRGLYPRLLRAAAVDLWDQGFNRILIGIEASNRNSIKAHRAAGARLVGSILALRILGVTSVHDGARFKVAWTGARGWLKLSVH